MKYKIEKKQMGGLIPNYKSQLQMVNRVNNSEVDFIKRLKDPNRQGIPDWTKFNDVASHRMAWATDNKGAVIYPEVQNINNQLIDFTRPPYHTWAGYNSAVQNRDTIRTTPQMAEWFTTNYKKYFPNFKSGGLIPKHQTGNYLSPLKSSKWLNRPQPEPYSIEKYRPELLKPKENFLDIAIPVIKKFESFKPNVYKDGKGIPTIGYGETRKEFITKGTMTEQEASDSMREYISNNILPTLTSQPYYGNLNDNQKASLVSLIYNIGQTKFRNSPGLQRALASGNWQEAVKQMDHGYNDPLNPGLRKRRDYERNLFLQ